MGYIQIVGTFSEVKVDAWDERSLYGFVPGMARCAQQRGLWTLPLTTQLTLDSTPTPSAGSCFVKEQDRALLPYKSVGGKESGRFLMF